MTRPTQSSRQVKAASLVREEQVAKLDQTLGQLFERSQTGPAAVGVGQRQPLESGAQIGRQSSIAPAGQSALDAAQGCETC